MSIWIFCADYNLNSARTSCKGSKIIVFRDVKGQTLNLRLTKNTKFRNIPLKALLLKKVTFQKSFATT